MTKSPREFNRQGNQEPKPVIGFAALILKELTDTVSRLQQKSPDAKHNTGRVFAEMFIWDEIAAMAKKRSDDLWKRAEGTFYRKDGLEPGTHTFDMSPKYTIGAKVSEPVKRFSVEALASLLSNSKYKVPAPITHQYCSDAKVPTKSSVTLFVAERTDV